MPDPAHLLYAQQFFHALAGRCGGILCRMTDGNERSHCLSFGHGEHLCHLVRVIDAHDDRPEAQCVRGKAEGLCGNTGVKGLPVAFERAGIAAVPLKTRASRHHRQLVMAGDNVLDFSLSKFVEFAKEKDTSCVMCHVENELKKQQKTAIITLDGNDLITSYEEKPKEPKGNLAVPPFYCYRVCDVKRIQEALDNGCGYDAPGSFAAWLSKQTPMHAYVMPGKRYDIGDINSYEYVKSVFSR